jgi:hypothetical protein
VGKLLGATNGGAHSGVVVRRQLFLAGAAPLKPRSETDIDTNVSVCHQTSRKR